MRAAYPCIGALLVPATVFVLEIVQERSHDVDDKVGLRFSHELIVGVSDRRVVPNRVQRVEDRCDGAEHPVDIVTPGADIGEGWGEILDAS